MASARAGSAEHRDQWVELGVAKAGRNAANRKMRGIRTYLLPRRRTISRATDRDSEGRRSWSARPAARFVAEVRSALLLGLDATAADSRGRASGSKDLSPMRKYRACTWQKCPTAAPSMPHRTRRVGQACRRYTPTAAKLHACLA